MTPSHKVLAKLSLLIFSYVPSRLSVSTKLQLIKLKNNLKRISFSLTKELLDRTFYLPRKWLLPPQISSTLTRTPDSCFPDSCLLIIQIVVSSSSPPGAHP